MTLEMFHKTEDEHYETLVNQMEANSETIDQILKKYMEFQELFGPYGKHKRDVIDSSFNTIIENLVPECFKTFMINLDKEVSLSGDEISKYSKMPKFEKHEKFPDKDVREWFDQMWQVHITEAQFRHLEQNSKPIFKKVINQLRESVKSLLESRLLIHCALIEFDACWRYFNSYLSNEEKISNTIKVFRHYNRNITSSQLWKIK